MNLAMRATIIAASFVAPTFCNFNPDGSGLRVYAHGIIAVHPRTGELSASANERDELGDNLPNMTLALVSRSVPMARER
jgi:glucose/arabinose dehydrogenase